MTDSHRQIDTFLQQVNNAVEQQQFEVNVRIPLLKTQAYRPDMTRAKRDRGGDAQTASRVCCFGAK